MAESTRKRRRLDGSDITGLPSPTTTATTITVFPNSPSAPATNDDRCNWKGFCEIESEPVLFNVMLKQFGVKGVKVQEVVSLDEELLAFLPRPVYGLIFLFKWKEEDPDTQEASCPDHVWFANQVITDHSPKWRQYADAEKTVNNACASVALLNIVNNIPGVSLGEHLQRFKEFTNDFSPSLRGDAIANFDFVKHIHNSFARKTDMLNADLQLKNDAYARKAKSTKATEDESTAGFHFIAFVPIDEHVWILDGLERQPRNLGPIDGEDWVGQTKPVIEARMAEYEEEQTEFAILGLVKDPLESFLPRLVSNVKTLIAVTDRLNELQPDWKHLVPDVANGEATATASALTSFSPGYGLDEKSLEDAAMIAGAQEKLRSNISADLIAYRQRLVTDQAGIRASIKEEQQSNATDAEQAASRRFDYVCVVQGLLRALIRKNAVTPLL